MELTLKQARRLEQAIANTIISKTMSIGSEAKITKYNVDQIEDKIAAEASKMKALFGEIDQLITIRYVIRREIELTNERCGLYNLMNIEEQLKNKRNIAQIVSAMKPVTEDDVTLIKSRLQCVETKESAYGGWNDTQSLPNVLDTKTIDEKKTELRDLTREIEQIADQCAALNSTVKISIIAPHEAVLVEAGLL